MATPTISNTITIKHMPLKRLFDIAFSLAILTFGAPVFLFILLLISLTSPGPIFFTHKRIGRGGKIILCWKFRTMRVGSEKLLENLLASDPLLKHEWENFYKLKNDPRVTPIGKFLRKTSLDELPQFFNVLKGDLSVVGPRPCVEEEVREKFADKMEKILSIRPGITGLWQTSGRSMLSWPERLKLEEEYVDTHSFKKDLFLIIKTAFVIFSSRGAF